jgi:glycine betaine catabolism A
MSVFFKTVETAAQGAMTLPGYFYTSSGQFHQEQERIFSQYWVAVGRAEEILHAGDFMVRTVAGESILLVRGRDGLIRAFYNLCRHRGTRLCEQTQGQFKNVIRCPYHSWAYGLDGTLLAAPSMKGVHGFQAADCPLHSVALATWEGLLFVSLADAPEPFEQVYAPLWDKFLAYNLPALRTARRIEYDVQANWKLIFENYSECFHCTSIHPDLVRLSPGDSGANDLVEGAFLGGYMEVKPDCESMTLSGRACSMAVGDLPPEDHHRVYYYSLFPNLLLSLHPDYVMIHFLTPEAPDRTHIQCAWLFHPNAADDPDFNPDDGVLFWDKTNREDWRICELSQLGVSSRAYTPGFYSPRESISAAFDREYLRAMEA